MASNAITYAEIDAFNRLTLAGLSAWDVALIRRLDDRVLGVKAGTLDPTTIDGRPAVKRSFGSMMRDRFPNKAKGQS